MNLETYIRAVHNYPRPGITFRDITPLLHSPSVFAFVIEQMAADWRGKVDIIAGLDARGFIFGTAIAINLNLPFMMVRKKGKLPGNVESMAYDLEYGSAVLEVSIDSTPQGENVLVVDDLLATGGTALAACKLIEKIGLTVAGCAFAIGLNDLPGKTTLEHYPITCLLNY